MVEDRELVELVEEVVPLVEVLEEDKVLDVTLDVAVDVDALPVAEVDGVLLDD